MEFQMPNLSCWEETMSTLCASHILTSKTFSATEYDKPHVSHTQSDSGEDKVSSSRPRRCVQWDHSISNCSVIEHLLLLRKCSNPTRP